MESSDADSGWAWVIVVAVSIINLSVLPVQQCFGLIFGKRFTNLAITATQTSLILHLNGTICCSLGLISGPMMKRFSYRRVAFFGSLTIVLGICMTAFALSLPTIIVGYCVIIGIGHGIVHPATSLAINTYFRKKRSLAMGFSVTLTGLGPILMPLLIVTLLETYDTTGTLLIIAGIATHSFIGASLLRPFVQNRIKCAAELLNNINSDQKSQCNNEKESEKIIMESCLIDMQQIKEDQDNSDEYQRKHEAIEVVKKQSIFQKIVINMDLELLRDKHFVSMILGMAISLVAETNFNMLIPFVLSELSGLKLSDIATIISVQATFDIAGRLCVPLLAQKFGWRSKNLYAISLIGSSVGRTILSTWGSQYYVVVIVAVVVGVAKGTKAVFQALIVPDYVPLERLPAASGILMVCNGILSISLGSFIGLAHDLTNSYEWALHVTSAMSLSCILLWILGGLLSPFSGHIRLQNNGKSIN